MFPPQPIDVEAIGMLFELSLGLSAWKEYQGSRWALRCNPSSGNLHPTEGYLIAPELPGLAGGVYHYAVDYLGNERLVFSTDFPHVDTKYPKAVERFLQLPLTDEDKRKILWDNCAAYYGVVGM